MTDGQGMDDGSAQFTSEVKAGARFEFGKNWQRFLGSLDEVRIVEAERSLREMLETEDLHGMSFLDVGCGSGLFSLAARRLGARVHSFDYDPDSVACACELRRRYFPDDADWRIETGSVLDTAYLSRLGEFDIVYSWGVLHHTGAMWQALANVDPLVRENGRLFIAIYNDQGWVSIVWRAIKRLYNHLPRRLKPLLLIICFVPLWGPKTVRDLMQGKLFRTWKNYGSIRGMSPWSDVVDWVGGYPFEVARPDKIIEFFKARSYVLQRLITTRRLGCNQFVFAKRPV
ncbi:MAG TPA: class I SAM-dependent methyltransferase [Armatimonadota bacterium]|nr:class I SAM-dependent methyltransferase [Armatimonadota bacterium]